MVDHYGVDVLKDSMQSGEIGAASLTYALAKNGFEKTFPQVFVDWTIAVLVNDCSVGENYCYLNANLRSLRIVPQGHFLPLSGDNVLTTNNTIKDWSGSWLKIVGGGDTLKIEVQGDAKAKFVIPYVIDEGGKISVHFLVLDSAQKGTLYIPDFNSRVKSVTLIPSAQTEISEQKPALSYQFGLTLSTVTRTPEQEEQAFIEELLAQIDFLTKEIARIQAQIYTVLASQGTANCFSFTTDLFFGMRDNSRVICLQEFLKSQGPSIYPESIVSGNFLSLTKQAVIRFQEQYADDILLPLSLKKGTGYVGSLTRAKINSLLLP